MSSTPRVFIVHGYLASPSSHWFPWLRDELSERGANVDVIPLPQSESPQLEAWLDCLKDRVGVPDERTHFVAHSLGCVATLKYLQAWPSDTRIGSLMLVAGFTGRLLNLPQLDGFTESAVDFASLRRMAPVRHVLLSENDMVVRPPHTEKLAEDLLAKLWRVPDAGHFLGSEGVTRLDQALEILAPRLHQGT